MIDKNGPMHLAGKADRIAMLGIEFHQALLACLAPVLGSLFGPSWLRVGKRIASACLSEHPAELIDGHGLGRRGSDIQTDQPSHGLLCRFRKRASTLLTVVKAVIDVGSNSVLTTVAKSEGGLWHPILETSEVTALGEGVKTTRKLSQEAIDRTLAAVKRGVDRARTLGAQEVVIAATMAARIAENRQALLGQAEAQATPMSVLSGDDEATLGFLAVADDPKFATADRLTIIDPGGHSTELVTAQRTEDGWRTLYRNSFPIGTLAMLSSMFSQECPDVRAQLAACRELDDIIGLVYLPQQVGTAVTLGATGTNLITIREAMPDWDAARVHGQWLDYEEVSKAVSWLSGMTLEERSNVVGMERGREKTLHAGALILERFLHATRALGCYVSVRGWRHALLERGLP
jgi:exopolyphosphatase/guanosine-5'-triphosphate,3'-diphosphate pyrophosphatase